MTFPFALLDPAAPSQALVLSTVAATATLAAPTTSGSAVRLHNDAQAVCFVVFADPISGTLTAADAAHGLSIAPRSFPRCWRAASARCAPHKGRLTDSYTRSRPLRPSRGARMASRMSAAEK
jgi:hypothetical protein